MEEFLNWLFSLWEHLRYIIVYNYERLLYVARWAFSRFRNLMEDWWGHVTDVIYSWYERIKEVVYDLWDFTHDLVANLYANVRSIAYVHFERIWFLIWQGWYTLTLIVNEWWPTWYEFWANLIGRVIQVVSEWYDILSELVVDLWQRLREIALDWYEGLLYLIQSLPSVQQLLGDWFPWLAWLFSTETRERLFAFLQDPLTVIWLYIIDAIEEKLEELLEAYW